MASFPNLKKKCESLKIAEAIKNKVGGAKVTETDMAVIQKEATQNVDLILDTINSYCKYLFNLEDINAALTPDGDWLSNPPGEFIKFFEECIKICGDGTVEEEIAANLFPFIYKTTNNDTWHKKNLSVPSNFSREIGFQEKLNNGKLESNFEENPEVYKNYAFTTLDMIRTGMCRKENDFKVIELSHLDYLKDSLMADNVINGHKPIYIRSSKDDKKGLPQWITLYHDDKGKVHIYSESPIHEDDKRLLAKLMPTGVDLPIPEGGAAALSMSSGIRACSYFVEMNPAGGAGLSSSADYFSLLPEWVWYVNLSLPSGGSAWRYFLTHSLTYKNGKYSFLDIKPKPGDPEYDYNGDFKTKFDNDERSYNHHILFRSYMLGLDKTLLDAKATHSGTTTKYLEEKDETVTLDIPIAFNTPNFDTNPEFINLNNVNTAEGYSTKAYYGITGSQIPCKFPGDARTSGNAAISFVLNTFRACAKKPRLTIKLPDIPEFQIDAKEQELIRFLMITNPFVTELENTHNNASLKTVKDGLTHIFARNRWLKMNKYLPPLLDDFWTIAAGYWINKLAEVPDLLSNDPLNKNNFEFKRCVNEMGRHGLGPLLAYLDAHQDALKLEFNALEGSRANPPVFFVGCELEADRNTCVDMLRKYLSSGKYFPFKRIQLSFIPGDQHLFSNFVQLINNSKKFDKITLSDCVKTAQDMHNLDKLLDEMIAQAPLANWTCTIEIPDIVKPSNDAQIKDLYLKYCRLNNILINNSRSENSKILFEIKTFKVPVDAKAPEVKGAPAALAPLVPPPPKASFNDQFKDEFKGGGTNLDLARVEGTTLQMQQQQQIKQERVRSIETALKKGSAFEDLLEANLIDFNNIDTLLPSPDLDLTEITRDVDSKATLKKPSDSPLQGYFRTWISANPQVDAKPQDRAKNIIQKMTPFAARMLVKYYRQLSGGLNVANLPRGFYTQRMASGELVLGYKPGLNYSTDHTLLTLKLREKPPKASKILGNYIQLDDLALGKDNIFKLKMLAQMQPELSPVEIDKRFETLKANCRTGWLAFLNSNELWVKNNWELVEAAYHSGIPDADIFDFPKKAQISPKEIVQELANACSTPESKAKILGILNTLTINSNIPRALGQAFDIYGKYGLERVFNIIMTMEAKLGKPFTDVFFTNYLSACNTFNPLLELGELEFLNQMIDCLQADPDELALFQAFLPMQMQAVGWEELSTIWRGFHFFYSKLKVKGLHQELTPKLLTMIPPQNTTGVPSYKPANLFPYFDRMLRCLDSLSEPALCTAFIQQIPVLDLTEGGVPYAVSEGFVLLDPSLRLREFEDGYPSYAPNLKDIYDGAKWKHPLHTRRALATKSHISKAAYDKFVKAIETDGTLERDNGVLWALHTHWPNADALLTFLPTVPNAFRSEVARHFHRVFYNKKASYQRFSLATFVELAKNPADFSTILAKVPFKDDTTLYECLNLFTEAELLTVCPRIIQLFKDLVIDTPPQKHLKEGLLLASNFGLSMDQLTDFYTLLRSLSTRTSVDFLVLTNQLLSLDQVTWAHASPADKLGLWGNVLKGIREMKANPFEGERLRVELMQGLEMKYPAIIFKSSAAGDFRPVTSQECTDLQISTLFPQHHERFTKLLTNSIQVSQSRINANSKLLNPLVEFFKRLQQNKTYINEVEPLLSVFEKALEKYNAQPKPPAPVVPPKYWTAEFFTKLLFALQPEGAKGGFPFGLLEAILDESQTPFAPVTKNQLTLDFDGEDHRFENLLNLILTSEDKFDRSQQATLARLALRTRDNPTFILELINELTKKDHDSTRELTLDRLLKNTDPDKYKSILDQARDLVTLPHSAEISDSNWSKVCQLYLQILKDDAAIEPKLIEFLSEKSSKDAQERVARILYIIAWSSLPSDDYPTVGKAKDLKNGAPKLNKLIDRLKKLSDAELQLLASYYPRKPAPDTRDLLGLIKLKEKGADLNNEIKILLTAKQAVHRQDYKTTSSAREIDLLRMIRNTYVIRGKKREPIPPDEGYSLVFMFKYLKQLEDGGAKISKSIKLADGSVNIGEATLSLSLMEPDELREVFLDSSRRLNVDPKNLQLRTQVWAILFEVLGRTTGKYPHLAQQFSLIANDLVITPPRDESSILKLKTGEGKSHFVAMRAAMHYGRGKKVDICTAKNTLAERDLADYKEFFSFLGIKTANIKPQSDRADFVNADVIYTTPADLSLFLDQQSSNGTPVVIERDKRVGLGDEFDFLYYEGQKTQYNFARQTGISPKEMSWFYRGLNEFYDTVCLPYLQTQLSLDPDSKPQIPAFMLQDCYKFLQTKATEEGQIYLAKITPIKLYNWLQSAYEAACLVPGRDYTTRLEKIKIGEDLTPMLEIHPLTKDMQRAEGSSLSNGVHQLLAERLNAKTNKTDHHVHPESVIISAQVFYQRLKSLWSNWEGFTGTVSAAQANELSHLHQTAVLEVPTNQKDRRQWPKPIFYDVEDDRLEQMVQDIKKRLAENKSILFCCKTDAEVDYLVGKLKTRLGEEEYEKYFLDHTQQSKETSKEKLDMKKKKEGNYLGQKAQGVVLLAAGFGRGDNVEVDTVMLTSVLDENDLLQKGGRTARNGEEGEVLQYYLKAAIDEDLERLITKGLPPTIKSAIDIELGKFNLDLKALPKDMETKFRLYLRLNEFIAARKNYPSVLYQQTKAILSEKVMEKIGNAKAENKEKIINGVGLFFETLDQKYLSLKQLYPNPRRCFDEIKTFIVTACTTGALKDLFENAIDIKELIARKYEEPQFIYDFEEEADLSPQLQTARSVQSLLLKIVNVPAEQAVWTTLINLLSTLHPDQRFALTKEFASKSKITYSEFVTQIGAFSGYTLQELNDRTAARQLKHRQFIDNPTTEAAAFLQRYNNALDILPHAPKKVREWISKYWNENPVDDNLGKLKKLVSMLEYSARNPGTGTHDWIEQIASFWKDPYARDKLLELPEDCFNTKATFRGDELEAIKNFLDKYIDSANKNEEASYVRIFSKFSTSMESQPEQRKRLFTSFEAIFEKSTAQSKELIENFANLSVALASPKHFTILKRLLEKLVKEYRAPRMSVGVLDIVLHDLSNMGGSLVEYLPYIESTLAMEGKEFVQRLALVCKTDAKLLKHTKNLDAAFFPPRAASKLDRMESYRATMQSIQEAYADKSDAELSEIFSDEFKPYLSSQEFIDATNKKTLFDGLSLLVQAVLPSEMLENLVMNPDRFSKLLALIVKYPGELWPLAECAMYKFFDKYFVTYLNSKFFEEAPDKRGILKGIYKLSFGAYSEFKGSIETKISKFVNSNPNLNDFFSLVVPYPAPIIDEILELDNNFATFKTALLSEEFRAYPNKAMIFEGIKALLAKGIIPADLKDFSPDLMIPLLHLSQQDKHLADVYAKLPSFEAYKDYLLSVSFASATNKDEILRGISVLNKANILPAQVLEAAKEFNDLSLLLTICANHPTKVETLTDSTSFNAYKEYLRSTDFSTGNQAIALAGIQHITKAEIPRVDLAGEYDNPDRMTRLLYHCAQYPDQVKSLVKIKSINAFDTYLSSTEFQHVANKEAILKGIIEIGSKNISEGALKAQFGNKAHMEALAKLSETYPDHIKALTGLKGFGEYHAYLATEAFASEANKPAIFHGISLACQAGIPVAFPANDNKMTRFLTFCHSYPEELPKIKEPLSKFAVIREHVTSEAFNSTPDKGLLFKGLSEISKKIAMVDNGFLSPAFDNPTKMNELLVLCALYPSVAPKLQTMTVDLIKLPKFDTFKEYLKSQEFTLANDDEKKKILEGIKAIAAKNIPDNELFPAFSNTKKMTELLLLCGTHEPLAKEIVHVLRFDSFKNYMATPQFNSAHYKNQLFQGMANLEAKKVEDSLLFPDFNNSEKMTHLLRLAAALPNYAHLLAALPVFSTLDDTILAAPKRQEALLGFFDYIQNNKVNLATIKAVIDEYSPDDLTLLLDLAVSIKERAVSLGLTVPTNGYTFEILTSSIGKNVSALTVDQQDMIHTFYLEEDRKKWMRKNFMGENDQDRNNRVALMTLFKQELFIPKVKVVGVKQFSSEDNQVLYQQGLDAYKTKVDSIFAPKTTSKRRSISPTQQFKVNEIMDELGDIATVLPKTSQGDKKELAALIKKQIKVYEGRIFKDTERYKLIESELAAIQDTDFEYHELIAKVNAVKVKLMKADIGKAAAQRFPRLTFWGQSRLYKTINDIEDSILKSWVADANIDVKLAEKFLNSQENTRDAHIEALKQELDNWQSTRSDKGFGLFTKNANNFRNAIADLTHDEIVDYLKDNQKEVSRLPGALEALAKEVLLHDARIEPKGTPEI